MKYTKYLFLTLMLVSFAACEKKGTSDPEIEQGIIEVPAVGGVEKVRVNMSNRWIVSTDNPWISISPANGVGAAVCEFKIDSALTATPRSGVVLIQNLDTWEEREIRVEQSGFDYAIQVEEPEVKVENYGEFGKRYFDVKVTSNVDFDVVIPEDAEWLSHEDYSLKLDRGLRPRNTTIRFNWNNNTRYEDRLAEVKFTPKKSVELKRNDKVQVLQSGAEPIEADTRAGDSTALVCISRSLQIMNPWNTAEPMTQWEGVVLWEEGMKGCTPEKVGRVKSADFYIFNCKESLPFEVRYLTAAEELYFFGNANTFMRDLDLGEDITMLTQLRRLTVGAYGLVSVPESLKNLKNLEFLDLGSNNFQRVPEVLTKENFPKLRTLILNANQRHTIVDLSNSFKKNLGGFIDEPEFPVDLIKWDLDTLVLSVNYLQGELPDFKDDDSVPCYTQEDINRCDTLPQFLVDRKIKKVMPSCKRFAINLNRLYGELPEWLLYHPALDWWIPESLVFYQEGRAANGKKAGFDNEPVNMKYYYDVYTKKKMANSMTE